MPLLKTLVARTQSWLSRMRSRRRRCHRQKQDQAKARYFTLAEIIGDSEGETFARRIAYLRRIDPLVFEELVLDAFTRQGWIVKRNLRYSGDGGIDGLIFREGHWYGVQCKRYREQISRQHLHVFAKVVRDRSLAGGFFVHTGRTPFSCRKAEEGIRIISGQPLIDFLLMVEGCRD